MLLVLLLLPRLLPRLRGCCEAGLGLGLGLGLRLLRSCCAAQQARRRLRLRLRLLVLRLRLVLLGLVLGLGLLVRRSCRGGVSCVGGAECCGRRCCAEAEAAGLVWQSAVDAAAVSRCGCGAAAADPALRRRWRP